MAYLGKTPSQAVRSRYYFTATGGETSLSGADDNANTLTFTDGNYVDVALNGVTLVAGTDYNTTTANTIGGLTALVASDVVEVIVYDTFSVFGGNMAANLNFKDNVKANFGTGNDLQIYHDGSNSIINDAGTGSLKFQYGGTDGVVFDSSGNVGIGETAPVTPLTITTANKLGSTFTGNINGEGLTVTQTNYTDGNYISLVEAAYDDSNDANPNVRIGAKFTGAGSSLAFGTTSNYGAGINNTAMTIDYEGKVGIGSASPQKKFVVSNAGAAGLEIDPTNRSGGVGTSLLSYNRSGSAYVRADYDASEHLMMVNGTERARFTANGLTFNGDTAAANALDDYEEGTWTPSLNYGTATFSYPKYTKIGNTVHISLYVNNFSDISTAASLGINGLPYTSTSQYSAGAVLHRYVNTGNGGDQITTYLAAGSSTIYFYACDGGGANYAAVEHSQIAFSTAEFYISMTYFTS